MAEVQDRSLVPRAVIQQQILEAAEARPDASVQELAAEVSGATPAIVDRVLAEYGDPGAEESDLDPAAPGHSTDGEPQPVSSGYSAIQREPRRLIAEHPTASQRDLGAMLGVSGSAVCQRLQEICGLEWPMRQEFVEQVFANDTTTPMIEPLDKNPNADLARRVIAVEHHVRDLTREPPGVLADPDLVHQIVHACFTSECISEDEELRIIEHLIQPTGTPGVPGG